MQVLDPIEQGLEAAMGGPLRPNRVSAGHRTDPLHPASHHNAVNEAMHHRPTSRVHRIA